MRDPQPIERSPNRVDRHFREWLAQIAEAQAPNPIEVALIASSEA